tara:strand:- start:128152 stop:129486 length:1335 start_codon:yes stop_codon:yes gene_type:complete
MPSDLINWSARRNPFRRLSLVAFLCTCAGLSCAAKAGEPTPYGEYFVRLGEHWPAVGAVAPQIVEPESSLAQDSASYEQELNLLESQGGPYASSLAEPLADLARLYRQGGDVKQAQQVYQRALHVMRVNEGLYSERQVPILKELFEIYRMTGDMATLDARYDYYFRLYGNGQPPYSPERLGAALEYLQWQREALRLEVDEREVKRLLTLYTLNEEILQGVRADPEADPDSYRELVFSQVRNLYLLENLYEPSEDLMGITPGSRIAAAPWGEEQDGNKHRLELFQRRALAHGRELLEDLIARTPPDQVEALATSYLELADWNQWNDRRTEALAAYGQVEEVLQSAGQTDLLEQLLGQPVELPANGVFWQPRQLPPGEAPVVVQVRYDVTARGRADNIEATAVSSEHAGKAGRVRRYLGQTRFRPRIVNGEPEAELQLLRDYEVLN